MAPLIDLSFPRTGLIKGKKIKNLLASYIDGHIKFSNLKIPLACVATDIETGEEVVINHGSVPEALRASISVPGIFTVVKREGRYLVDGGLANPMPVNVVKRMGADFTIAASVSPYTGKKIQQASTADSGNQKDQNIFSIIRRLRRIADGKPTISGVSKAGIIIAPAVQRRRTRPGDYSQMCELISAGEQVALRAIPKMKKQLGL